MKTDGASGGPSTPALIRDRSSRVRWLRNIEAGEMEQRSIGVLDYCTSDELHSLARGWGFRNPGPRVHKTHSFVILYLIRFRFPPLPSAPMNVDPARKNIKDRNQGI